MDDVGDLDDNINAVVGSSTKKPPAPQSGVNKGMFGASKYDPLPWTEFFDNREMVDAEDGGQIPVYIGGTGEGHIFLCLHGAGLTACSFAALAKLLKTDSTCISFDFRGHGANTQPDGYNMDKDNLVKDTIAVIRWITARFPEQSVVIVGHSMGCLLYTSPSPRDS